MIGARVNAQAYVAAIAVACALGGASLQAQRVYPRGGGAAVPFATVSPECKTNFANTLAGMEGSDAYTSMRFQLQALGVAQQGKTVLDTVTGRQHFTPNSVGSAAPVDSNYIQALSAAKERVSCAEFLIAQWHLRTLADMTTANMSMSVYDRLARTLQDRIELADDMLSRPEQHTSRQDAIRDDLRLADVDAKDREAVDDLNNVNVVLLSRSADAAADTHGELTLSCDERSTLMEESRTVAATRLSVYQQVAGSIFDFLFAHPCAGH